MKGSGYLLALSRKQAAHLANACAAYRTYAWRELPASEERNHILRGAQTMQGRLIELQAAPTEQVCVQISREDHYTLRIIVHTLMLIYRTGPISAERDQFLGDLADLRALLERVHFSIQTF